MSYLHWLVRTVNRHSPTTHGRQFLMAVVNRIAGRPRNGVHTIAPGVVMDLDMSDWMEETIYYHAFEPLCRSIILGHLAPEAVFVDIGANLGLYSLLARKRVGPTGRVIAFEPNPDTLARLRHNLELNGMEIELFDVALSNRNEVVTLYAPEGSHGETSMRNSGWSRVVEKPAQALRLDDVLPKDLDRIDFLKIDVEGAEALVFDGGRAVLRRFHPPILLEINEKASRAFGLARYEATKILLETNPEYRLYEVTSHCLRPTTLAGLEAEGSINANLLLTCEALPKI